MGVDKSRLPVGDQPLAERTAAILRAAGCAEVSLIRRGEPDGLGWNSRVIWEDEALPRHVLSGLISALDDAEGAVLVAACDLIDIDRDDVRAVMAIPGSVARDGRAAVLVHLRQTDRPAVWSLLQAQRPFAALADGLLPVERPGALRNVNRWEDLAQAHPIELLTQRLGLVGEDAERLERGERARLAARGCLLP